MDIKKYLEGYKIETADKLVSHIVELKRNTSPDFKLISELVHHLESEYNDFGIHKDDVITSSDRGEKEIITFFNQPKKEEISLKELRENTINDVSLGLNIKDILGISLCDNKEYIHKLVEKKIAERDKLIIYPLTTDECIEKERVGVKQNQTEQKAPVFTYCKVNKNALEALSLRALYGHNKYKQFDKDWQNFTRVENGDFEYSNAEFRHALAIGGEETEEEHLIAAAWNAVARLEIYFRNKLNKS